MCLEVFLPFLIALLYTLLNEVNINLIESILALLLHPKHLVNIANALLKSLHQSTSIHLY
jgi:hypothetical protein